MKISHRLCDMIDNFDRGGSVSGLSLACMLHTQDFLEGIAHRAIAGDTDQYGFPANVAHYFKPAYQTQ